MLKGMKGYHPTQIDMEFMEKMNEEKIKDKLQVTFDIFKVLPLMG